MLPLMRFVLSKQITCKLNHPTPLPWTDASWTVQAQVIAPLPQLLYDKTSVICLVHELHVLGGHLQKLSMIEEASCARSIASELEIESEQQDPLRKTSEMSDYRRHKALTYEMYKYLYILYLQGQDRRLADRHVDREPVSISPLLAGGRKNGGKSVVMLLHEQVSDINVGGSFSSNNTCNVCDTFFARPAPNMPSSNNISDSSSIYPHQFRNNNLLLDIGVSSLRLFKLGSRRFWRRRGRVAYCTVFNYQRLARSASGKSKPDTPEEGWGIELIKWAVRRSPQPGRATVKEICDSIRSLHGPEQLEIPRPSGDEQNKQLRFYVRSVLTSEPQFRLLGGTPSGHYWTCVEVSEEVEEQFDLSKLVHIAGMLQKYGYPQHKARRRNERNEGKDTAPYL
ncbi:hypothetical protein FRB94_004009 [Tulasnella sp. JGI-2019a]|nr:hypothetical protein FRB94_004009 [Tulasnella sp. JGI-2019a]